MTFLSTIFRKISQIIVFNNPVKKYVHQTACLFGRGDNIRKALLIPYQKEEPKKLRKISVIGASGNVGRSIVYTLLLRNFCDEIILFDAEKRKKKLAGETLDFLHCTPFMPMPRVRCSSEYEATANSDVVIIAAGKPRTPGMSRMDLAKGNVEVMKVVAPCVSKVSPDAVLIVVTNPVDIMSYFVWKFTGFDKNRILGLGTEIDSARFRVCLSKRLGINPKGIHGYLVGEHGESCVPLWTSVNITGTKFREIDPSIGTSQDENCWSECFDESQEAGQTMITLKGHTNWGISAYAADIAFAVLKNTLTVHSVSIMAKGMHEIDFDVFMSLPVVIGNRGVRDVIQQVVCDEERELIKKSACRIKEIIKKFK